MMNLKKRMCLWITCLVSLNLVAQSGDEPVKRKPVMISGVYPQLAVFNDKDGIPCAGDGHEIGIGAITPWAGKLWMITYSPHCPGGSSDKLYSIDEQLNLKVHAESVGGTPANRMIHRESNQLLTGPYLVDAKGKVRVISPKVMPGRLTATARHLKDPANMVYYYDMEGMLYEANVHTLAVNKLFHKPVPGWHGKGAYTAQKQLIISNNGEHKIFDIKKDQLLAGGAPKSKRDIGVLASWDGNKWQIIERRQFTDITGPGGIYGAPDDNAPAWSIGWDDRSVILNLLDGGKWYTYRLPKSTNTYDHWGGWYTEWPRIREIGNNKMLLDMHGMFYDFPTTFSRTNSGGISPVSNHLRYVPDFCSWNGKLVLSTDETSAMAENPLAGRSQSNLWFGQYSDLKEWGAANGWGGPWVNDTVQANTPSDPFLIHGFEKKVLHLKHEANAAITFTLEIDVAGNNIWKEYKRVTVPAKGYSSFIFPADLSATWIRVKANKECTATAWFHFSGEGHTGEDKMFAAIAGVQEKGTNAALIIPASKSRNLQVVANDQYFEVDENLYFSKPAQDQLTATKQVLKVTKDFETDEASVIIRDKSGTYRLPKTAPEYDKPFAGGWPRGNRELESERGMINVHGTFYEVPREAGFAAIRPITTHRKQIMDYCTWRGLLVISGTKKEMKEDGHYVDGPGTGLWFGAIDDLWKLGKPVGEGGVWKNTAVKKGVSSLPYLMTGYDKKKITLTADNPTTFTIEVNFDRTKAWSTYQVINVPAGKSVTYEFPDGYNAHWVRVTADKDCIATAWLKYE